MAVRDLWARLQPDREADVFVQPETNGRPQVRLRNPDAVVPARPSVRRRVLQPLPLVGVLLVLVALGGYWSVYSATTARTPVLVAARDLQSGAVLRPSDLRTAELAGDSATMAALVAEAELDTVIGRELTAPVPAGAPLARASVTPSGSGPPALTLVVPVLHALGGELRPGDRVTVLATFRGGSAARARAIARGLRVLAVGDTPETLDAASATIPVTVALPDPTLAAGLALANAEGKIDLLREGAKGRTAPIPSASEGGS
ncbi:MAG TPA: Flp pilus assembly protein CpaB [Gaiellaceae bacterium]|nr:Flp pilus assembly protein CpaB [Gaiellaceae bacterium]